MMLSMGSVSQDSYTPPGTVNAVNAAVQRETNSLNSELGTITDKSSGAIKYNAIGDTYRGLGAEWFNAGNIAREDFARNEQAKDNDLLRQKELFRLEQAEAQKNREWQERMSSTAYQRAIKDMQVAGLNPALLMSNQGASTPSGSVARVGSSGSSGYGKGAVANSSSFLGLMVGIAKMAAGLITQNPESVVSGFFDVISSPKGITTHTRHYQFK